MKPSEYTIGRYRYLNKEIERLHTLHLKRGWGWVFTQAILFTIVSFVVEALIEVFSEEQPWSNWFDTYAWWKLALRFAAWLAVGYGLDVYDVKSSLRTAREERTRLRAKYPTIEEVAA